MAKYILSILMTGKPKAVKNQSPKRRSVQSAPVRVFPPVSGCIFERNGLEWSRWHWPSHSIPSYTILFPEPSDLGPETRVVPSTINNLTLAQSVVYAGGNVSLKYANYQDLNAVIKNKQNDFMDSKKYENRALELRKGNQN